MSHIRHTIKLATLLTALALSVGGALAAGAREGNMCGGLAGIQCGHGLFCEFPPSAKCGAGDRSGKCTAKRKFCTREYRPVCGCNGKTFGNDCERKGAGVGKAHNGKC